MKIALLHNVNRYSSEHEAEFDSPTTINRLLQALAMRHEVVPVEATRDMTSWIARLQAERPDLVFNVAEGFAGAARETLFPAILENLGIAYSGPGPTELLVCHNKQLTKRLLCDHDIPTPWSAVLRGTGCLESFAGQALPFPLIVKLNSEGSSLAMDENCIVGDWQGLSAQVGKVEAKYAESILIEAYLPGRDLSSSFIEGLGTFGPVEYRYPRGDIYDFELKTTSNHMVEVVHPSDISREIRAQLLSFTSRIADVLGIRGYGRADFRLSTDGSLHFLEMNAQVSFHPDGAFVLAARSDGHSFDDVVLHIVECAEKSGRQGSSIARWNYSSNILR